MSRPGTLPGDRCVYDGRRLLGTIRNTTAGVLAFSAEGKVLGAFANQKAGMAAIRETVPRGSP
jgi:hypothetical protein